MYNEDYKKIQDILSELHLWSTDHIETQNIIDRITGIFDNLISQVNLGKKFDKMMDLSDVIDIKF